MSSTDVVVTGYGATTPLGGDAASTWDALLAGRSGVSRLDAEWVDRFDLPVKIAAQLAVEPTEVLKRVEARRLDRCRAGGDRRRPGGLGARRAAPATSRWWTRCGWP